MNKGPLQGLKRINLSAKKGADFDSYGEAIVLLQDFIDQVVDYFFAGSIPSLDEAAFLIDSAFYLQTQIEEFSPDP